MEKPFLIYQLFFGEHEPAEGFWSPVIDWVPLFHTAIVFTILIALVLAFNRSLKRIKGDPVPTGRFDLINLFDILISGVISFEKDLFGHEWKKYIPVPLALFVIILASNMLGLIPYFEPSTANVNTNAAMAVTVFCLTHIYGFRVHGISYLKQFTGPVWWLSPLMTPIEIIGHLARVLSLSIRLFGNMFADHSVVTLFLVLAAPVIPSIFMGLGVLVMVIQAFIFSILSVVYFSMAVSEEH
jgi:F-type H+-transporting ATPase subunit a